MSYTTQYPPAHNATYVKATTRWEVDGAYYAHSATNPALGLTGNYEPDKSWISGENQVANQRVHVDLGSAKIIRRIYYENSHYAGLYTNGGAYQFTFWGSNTAGSFADLTYGNDGGWTQLTISQSSFDQHVGADQADPKYITVTNTTAYRYYAFKISNNYGFAFYMALRHVALQTEDVVAPTVTTGATTNIRNSSAVGNGNVTSDGGGTITARGICYGTSINPTTAGTKVAVAGTTGAFSATLPNLLVGKRYFARAYATNWMGTSYGANVEFTTRKPLLMIF